MGVTAANFHDPVMTLRVSQATDFCRRFHDQLRIAEFVYVFHGRP
jgi:hypothetical protein